MKERISSAMAEGGFMLVCPEQLGGLTTPREAVEIMGGDGASVLAGNARVKSAPGTDVTESFIRGAHEVLHAEKELFMTDLSRADSSAATA